MIASPYYAEHEAFIDAVLRFTRQELAPKISDWERAEHFPNEAFTLLGQQGFLGLLISEKYGGVGGDYKLAGAWCEAFGELPSVGLTVAVNMHSLVISHALEIYGTEEAKSKWLPRAVVGDAIGAYAFTEPGAGSDLARIRTTATRKGSSWLINGSKTFITNGARADYILVLTKTDPQAGYGGFTTFVVDAKSKGFKVSRKLHKVGWHASDTAELFFTDVEVDDSCVLGKVGEGWAQAAANLNWERLMLTLTSLAGARMCLEDAARYARERKAFNRAVAEFPPVAVNHHECRALVAAAKRMVCDDAVWIADRAIQIHGGYGYTTEYPPERWW